MQEKHRFFIMLLAAVAIIAALTGSIRVVLDEQLEEGLFAESVSDKIRLMEARSEPPLAAAIGDSRVQNHYSTRVFEKAGIPFANLGVPQHNVEYAPSRVDAAAKAGAKYILVQVSATFLRNKEIVSTSGSQRDRFEKDAHFLDWWDVMLSQPFQWSMLPALFNVILNAFPARYALYDQRVRAFSGVPDTVQAREALAEIRKDDVTEDEILYLRGQEDKKRWVALLRNGDGVVSEHGTRATEAWNERDRCEIGASSAKCPDRRFACVKQAAKCPRGCSNCPGVLGRESPASAREFIRRMASNAAKYGSHVVVVIEPKIRPKVVLNSENLESLTAAAPNVCLIDASELVFDASHWADQGHYNSKGRRRFSEIMAEAVLDIIRQGCHGQVFRPASPSTGGAIAGR